MNKTALALGTFDGLHLGHQRVLKITHEWGLQGFVPSMLLFNCHPQKAIFGSSPPLLITEEDKIKLIRQMGVQPLPIDFNEIRNLSPEDFVTQILLERFNAGVVICGENFHFGKMGAGNSKILKKLCEQHGIIFCQAENIYYENELISATRIRKCLQGGEIEKANAMLGRPFSYYFLVVEGNKIGKKYLGFPTINQHFPADFIELQHGVYASYTVVDGVTYPSVTNFGCHPTIGGDLVLSETCILGFEGNLYNQKINVNLLKFIRGEKKFGSKDELKLQIEKDSKIAIEIFNSENK